jgi:hypothetical protein
MPAALVPLSCVVVFVKKVDRTAKLTIERFQLMRQIMFSAYF